MSKDFTTREIQFYKTSEQRKELVRQALTVQKRPFVQVVPALSLSTIIFMCSSFPVGSENMLE